ncbi:BTAD domain-containing putative transcriptional regulator [Uniformispora flossi]|uniref:BTAD domain-containing putative transcriptional regulator n=1 Tax=Uniformispora flossi TaxID=3390723 RepID=UPI003C2CB93D
MRFTMLGPLEAVRDDGPVPLGGTNQRALLAFLLLHPNRVVATSELVKALWGEAAPPTARKMVQNAVAGLRRALGTDTGTGTGTGTDTGPELATVSPGYVLRIDPDAIDLTQFDTLIRRGRAALRAGDSEPGALLLREALGLWQGPVVADVAETGVRWPELAVIRETRLTAFEECVEAELALGRHREVVGELAAMGQQEPTRERTCGLLMLALYRCGRQAEALAAYQRLRDGLVDGFGLDPAPELQSLERSILNQHPVLDLLPPPGHLPNAAPVAPDTRTRSAPAPADAPPAAPALTERKQASILLIRARAGTDDPEQLDEAQRDLHRIITEEAARFGGLVREPVGPIRPVLFGLPRTHEDDPSRAVRTAVSIRDRLDLPDLRITVHMAVATGEVLARYRSEDDRHPAEVTGAVLDHCEQLLQSAGPQDVRTCDRTRAAAADVHPVAADAAGSPPAQPREQPRTSVPLIGRDRELDLLSGLLDDVRRRERPHLVTVLGEPGIGKSRLAAEFGRRIDALPVPVRRLAGRVTAFGRTDALAPLAAVVRAYCGIPVGATAAVSDRRLAGAVRDLLGAGPAAERVLSGLRPCLGLGATVPPQDGPAFAEVFAAWRTLVEEIAARQPVVLVLEDLHLADEAFLDQVEDLTERALRVPLLIVATARTELRRRRPRWCCGKRDATAVLLDPLSDTATTALLDRLQTRPPGIPVAPNVLALIGGIPRYAEEYAPTLPGLPAHAVPEVPPALRALVTARLDTLPVAEKAVLRDAAAFEGPLWTAGVAAVGGRTLPEVDAALRALERTDFLRRVRRSRMPDDTEYVIRHRLVRDIAYAQLTRQDRLLRHRRAIAWIDTLPADCADLLVHHFRKVGTLSATSGRPADSVVEEACQALIDAGRRAAEAGSHDSALRCYQGAVELSASPVPRSPRGILSGARPHGARRPPLPAGSSRSVPA